MADYIVRATAAEGQIRAFAATTKEMAETARKAHDCSPVATAALGRLLTAGAMMGVIDVYKRQLLSRITNDLFDISELLHHGPEDEMCIRDRSFCEGTAKAAELWKKSQEAAEKETARLGRGIGTCRVLLFDFLEALCGEKEESR